MRVMRSGGGGGPRYAEDSPAGFSGALRDLLRAPSDVNKRTLTSRNNPDKSVMFMCSTLLGTVGLTASAATSVQSRSDGSQGRAQGASVSRFDSAAAAGLCPGY